MTFTVIPRHPLYLAMCSSNCHLMCLFTYTEQPLDGEAYMAIAFDLLRLLGRNQLGGASNSWSAFGDMLRMTCGIEMTKKKAIEKCADCFRRAVQVEGLFPG
jgi:hypothetical protein